MICVTLKLAQTNPYVSAILLALAFAQACTWAETKNAEAPLRPLPVIQQTQAAERMVQFDGVSFRYDPNVFGDVKNEIVPECRLEKPDSRPDYVAPAHVRFTFDLGSEHNKAELSVYPLAEFPTVYAVNSEMVDSIRDQIKILKLVLKNQSYRDADGDIPHLPYRDASDTFFVKVRRLDFSGGKGIVSVTHWTHGVDLVSNRNLLYRFEGITDDGKYYVTAETPVSVTFLPNGSVEEFEGFTWQMIIEAGQGNPSSKKRYDAYIESITNRLEKLGPNDFQPHLEKFESIIKSLKVTK